MLKKILFTHSLPLQLIMIIAGVILLGGYLPESLIRCCYTFSSLFKEVLGLVLPFIIFAFVASGILAFKKNAPLILLLLLSLIFISNGFVALLVYWIAQLFLPTIISQDLALDVLSEHKTLTPFYEFSLQLPISSEKILIAAVLVGLTLSFYKFAAAERGIKKLKYLIELFFSRIFIPLLPLYVLGFLLKIQYEGILGSLFQNYGMAFVLIVAFQICYLGWFYFLAAGFSLTQTLFLIKNALPSYVTAFSTMSSTATLPISIPAAERNTGNSSLSQMGMPILANVHLLGDAISTPLLTLVSMSVFLHIVPTFSDYMMFIFYFCIAMFAASGVPGGGIIVMIPLLKSQMHFTPEMVSVIMTLYLLLDSFGTAANVMGDGALIVIVQKLLKKLKIVD